MKDMYDYIMETPDAIREVIEKSKQNNEDCIRYIKGKKIGHIYLVASGTSYSAALSCIKLIEKLMNIPVYAVYAMEFVDNTDIVEDNDGENKIVLNEITLDMITFSINENGYLIISINDSEDVLTIKNFNSELFAFEFADGMFNFGLFCTKGCSRNCSCR